MRVEGWSIQFILSSDIVVTFYSKNIQDFDIKRLFSLSECESSRKRRKGRGKKIVIIPSTVILFRSGSKGNANVADSFGTNAWAATHHLIQMDSQFLVIWKLFIHPVPSHPHIYFSFNNINCILLLLKIQMNWEGERQWWFVD